MFFLWINFIHPIQFFEKEMKTEIFYMNTYYYNSEFEDIVEKIKQIQPEIIFLVEANELIISKLKSIYGKPIIEINESYNSYVLFTNKPPISYEIKTYTNMPKYLKVKFDDFTFIGLHANDPLTKQKREFNLNLFKKIAEEIKEMDLNNEKFIVVGDFNNTYYSATFRLHFEKFFHKNIYSWSTNRPWALPIDHALSNFKIEISPTKKLSSDHNGLLISRNE